MNIRFLLLATISGPIIALDQLTKMSIITRFELGESYEVIPGFFSLTYVRNSGAAFGFMQNIAPAFRDTFFLVLPPAIMVFLIYFLKGLKDSDRIPALAISLIFGGALGNYIDRLRFRYVIDFLDFHYKDFYYPAFNVADSCIVVGMIIFIFLISTKRI